MNSQSIHNLSKYNWAACSTRHRGAGPAQTQGIARAQGQPGLLHTVKAQPEGQTNKVTRGEDNNNYERL